MKSRLSVKQNGFKDCAGACLLSIIRYYNGNISKEEISYLIKTDINGTNAYNLIEGAKKIGFNGYGIKISFKEFIKNEQNLPVIAHTKYLNMYHYIVIYEINKKYIKIMDPSYGIKKISYKEFKDIFLETIIVLYPVNKIPDIKVKDKIIKRMFENVLLNKSNVVKILILSLLITILSIIISFYLKVYIDYVYKNFNLKLLINVTVCFLLIIFLKNVFDNIRSKLLINIKKFVSRDITNNSINHIMNLPYCYFKNKPVGEIVSRIEDLDNFKDLVSTFMLNIFVDIFLMLGSIVILLIINRALFIISLFIIIIYSVIVFIYSYIFKTKIYNLQVSHGEYKKELIETINSYETIKNLNLTNNFIYKVILKFNNLTNKIKNFEIVYSNEKMLKNIVSDIGIILLTSIGVYMVYKRVLSIGDLIAFTSLVLLFLEPIKELLNLVPNIRYAVSSYERINDLLMIEMEICNNKDTPLIEGNIEIENLSYSYNNVDYIIKDLNLCIKNHSKYLLHGQSGIGKSTLIKIILGYLEDYKGSIKINGINIKDIEKSRLRNSITYISQKEILLSDTIKNNIILGRNINDKKYNEIVKICRIDKIIETKSGRNEFMLEENGFNLSGGERQKIILARGLLKNSNIIVLDEALSEVGFDEEKEIIDELLKKYEKKTIIYISHKKDIKTIFEYKYDFSKRGEENVKQ